MSKIKLSDIDTRAPKDWDKQATKEKNIKIVEELDDLQNLLYAERKTRRTGSNTRHGREW